MFRIIIDYHSKSIYLSVYLFIYFISLIEKYLWRLAYKTSSTLALQIEYQMRQAWSQPWWNLDSTKDQQIAMLLWTGVTQNIFWSYWDACLCLHFPLQIPHWPIFCSAFFGSYAWFSQFIYLLHFQAVSYYSCNQCATFLQWHYSPSI